MKNVAIVEAPLAYAPQVDRVFKTDQPLTTHQKNAYAETCAVYGEGGDGIRAARIMANAPVVASSTAAFPKGHAIHFSGEAIAQDITMSPHDYKCTVLCKIVPKDGQIFKDEFFTAKKAELDKKIPQYSASPICAGTRDTDNQDFDYWTEEIAENGYAGIVSKKRGAHAKDYYVIASCGAPILGQQTISSLMPSAGQGKGGGGGDGKKTWSAVADSRELTYWKNAAERNACRIAHRVSEAMGVTIQTGFEYGTFKMNPHSEADRVTASPDHVQFVSSIRKTVAPSMAIANMTTDTVAQYSHCSPIARAEKPYHLVAVSPFEGHIGFALPKGAVDTGMVLPTTTGRQMAISASLADFQSGKLEPETVDAIDSRYIWEGKANGVKALADRLHPEAYRSFNAAFISSAIAPLLKVTTDKINFEVYEPVCMKVAARVPRQQKK